MCKSVVSGSSIRSAIPGVVLASGIVGGCMHWVVDGQVQGDSAIATVGVES